MLAPSVWSFFFFPEGHGLGCVICCGHIPLLGAGLKGNQKQCKQFRGSPYLPQPRWLAILKQSLVPSQDHLGILREQTCFGLWVCASLDELERLTCWPSMGRRTCTFFSGRRRHWRFMIQGNNWPSTCNPCWAKLVWRTKPWFPSKGCQNIFKEKV